MFIFYKTYFEGEDVVTQFPLKRKGTWENEWVMWSSGGGSGGGTVGGGGSSGSGNGS